MCFVAFRCVRVDVCSGSTLAQLLPMTAADQRLQVSLSLFLFGPHSHVPAVTRTLCLNILCCLPNPCCHRHFFALGSPLLSLLFFLPSFLPEKTAKLNKTRMSSLSSHLSSKRRLEIQAERDHSQTQLSLALSPVLTSGYYSESLSQSVSARRPSHHQSRRSTPPPAPLAARDEGVVIQAGMSFVLGHKAVRSSSVSAICVGSAANRASRPTTSTGVRQHFRPLPAHTMADTTSSKLSRAIRDFLGRTDHVMNEWKHLGKEAGGSQRSRSTTRSYAAHQSGGSRRFSARSLSSSRYSSTDSPSSGAAAANEFVVVGPFSRVPSFQSVQSTADTDFGSCQDLNDYDEVSHPLLCLLTSKDPFPFFDTLGRIAVDPWSVV